ncbi:MAG: rhodanese-like domain-containing protein [Sandaracinaceae bacterium]|nr:rhodanese-like domain-containing protein [Sandaracinaceae bacterium]MDW8245825.1 rhodanese-like domain-containing protein [Sandaracinaceae bacterium]
MFSFFRRSSPQGNQEARQWVSEGAVLLDVRTPAEYAEGHLPGAINIPVQELEARTNELPKGSRIVVYCRSGARSARAKSLLEAKGFKVLDLGPMSAY